MLRPVAASIALGMAILEPASAMAQPNVLTPMSVETYRVMLRVSRNAGWGATAYRNYLIGLFEGLLNSQSKTAGERHGRLFCLPADKTRGSVIDTFEWLETEINNVVAKAPPDASVAQTFLAHLSARYPCQG